MPRAPELAAAAACYAAAGSPSGAPRLAEAVSRVWLAAICGRRLLHAVETITALAVRAASAVSLLRYR